MSILTPKEENVSIAPEEILQIIAHDLGVNEQQIKIHVLLDNKSQDYFNHSIQEFKCLSATVHLPGKTQKFDIFEKDVLSLLEKYTGAEIENLKLEFEYQSTSNNLFELIRINVKNKLDYQSELPQEDLLSSSLNNMNHLINSIPLENQSLSEMSKNIDSLEDSIQKARELMSRRKF